MSEENLETQIDENEEVVESSVDEHGYDKDDIRSVIAAEMDKHEAAEADNAEKSVKEDNRDESGRFKKAESSAGENTETQNSAEPTEASAPARNPWASWKKEAQSALSQLPPETQRMIQEREEQFHKGIEQYKQDAYQGRTLGKALAPHMEYLNQVGVPPEQAISHLIAAEKLLRTSDQQTKTNMFMKLAHDYGIDINSLTNVPFDPYKYQLEQQLAQQQAMLNQIQQSRQIAEEAQLGQTIEQFAQTHEYFDELREPMADLLDKGLAKDLEEAYFKSLSWRPDLQTKPANQLQRANNAAKAAKAAAVQVKGSPVGGMKATEAKSTEEAVRNAMAALGL